jgi:hypothetical protein
MLEVANFEKKVFEIELPLVESRLFRLGFQNTRNCLIYHNKQFFYAKPSRFKPNDIYLFNWLCLFLFV